MQARPALRPRLRCWHRRMKQATREQPKKLAKPPKPKPVHFAAFPVGVYEQRAKTAGNELDGAPATVVTLTKQPAGLVVYRPAD